MRTTLYRDRRAAGRRLAARVERLRQEAPVILAVPRDGVPVAMEVAEALAAPLDVLAVRKIGPPGRRVGAAAEGGLAIVDHDRARELGLTAEALSGLRERARRAADDDGERLRSGAAPLDIVGRTVVIVDDGAQTGDTVVAVARTARRRGAARIVLAVPSATAPVLARLGEELDEVICIEVAPLVDAYDDGRPMDDCEIAAALRAAGPVERARLHLPQAARAAIVLATGSGIVRRTLEAMGFATLQVDDADADGRLAAAAKRFAGLPAAERLPLALFGLGPTAAPALTAAAEARADAVVAAGGRPDRALERIACASVPTLLIVGGEDRVGQLLAHEACEQLAASEHRVAVVAGATRDFGEPGALGQVAHLAGGWFARHLVHDPR